MVERKRTLRTIAWSILFVIVLSGLLFYFGVPLLIKMAVFISELKQPSTSQQAGRRTTLQAPEFDALPESTPSASIVVSGFAPPKSSVIVKVNGKEQPGTLAKADGSFEIRISLADGDNTIVAQAKSESGDESPDSKPWTVVRDEISPELTMITPADNAKFSGDTSKIIQFQGKTESGSTVTINNRFILVASDGTFMSQVQLSQGDNRFDVIATDKAGNQTLAQITVNWQP